jgi:hypothetical protein
VILTHPQALTFAYTIAYLSCYHDLAANGFDWDKGNRAKCEKHGLSTSVIEGLFTRPLAILPDAAHSQRERRFRAIGRTDKGACSSCSRACAKAMNC